MRIALFAAVAFFALPAHAQIISGPVQAVDGDSLRMGEESIRLFGIDAPEATQTCNRQGEEWQCGRDAAALLAELVTRGEATCEQRDVDIYGRAVAVCRVGRLDLAAAMTSAGYAVALPDFSDAYVESAAQAERHRLGIWASEFIPPADFRAANPSLEREARVSRRLPSAEVSRAERASTYYRNCNEARAAGAAPLYRGQPGYRPEMDGDSDGIACEPYRGRR